MKNTSYIKNEVVNRFTIKRITEENKSDEEKNWEDDEIARLTRMLEEFKEFKKKKGFPSNVECISLTPDINLD